MHSHEICGSLHLSQPTPEDYDPRPEGVRILVRGGAGLRPATPMNRLQPALENVTASSSFKLLLKVLMLYLVALMAAVTCSVTLSGALRFS